jgi:hypothetical protein
MSNELAAVPNGTDVASPVYLKLVKQYWTHLKQTFDDVLNVGETVAEANRTLSEDDLARFCAEVGLEGSTYRKWLAIGEAALRLRPVREKAPGYWTTIYTLASLEGHEFERVVNDDRFNPKMTAKDIYQILGRSSAQDAGRRYIR